MTNDMNHFIEVQSKSGIKNEKGDTGVEWVSIYKGYASVRNLNAREYWEAATINAENTLKFRTRWHSSLDVTDPRKLRLLWHDKKLDVKSISNVEHRNEIVEIRAVVKNG